MEWSALFDGLRAGARGDAGSVGAWMAHLGEAGATGIGARFLAQLEREWYPAPAPDALCTSVAAEVREHLYAWGRPGWHLWAHVQRVTGTALHLADADGADARPVYLASLLHDVAKLDEDATGIPHEDMGAAFAADVLRGDVTPGVIAAIQAAIRRESGSMLGDILHDADKLDKIGAAGIVRRVAATVESGGLAAGLARVGQDASDFPAMHFDASRALAQQKRAFLDWFLPQAWDALDRRA